MIYEDKNWKILDETLFNEILNGSEKKSFYLYHYILAKYEENSEIKTLEIDQVKDLYRLKDKLILYKYYIKKIHYYTEPNHSLDEYGDTYYIHRIGHFFIDGLVGTNEEELTIIRNMFKDYNKKYPNVNIPSDDEKFLSLNKSVINF